MKVLVKEPGKPYEFREIKNTLEAMHALVGGYLEQVNLREGLVLLCDEDGRQKELPWNAVVKARRGVKQIVGTFFVCGVINGKHIGFKKKSRTAAEIASNFSCHEFGEEIQKTAQKEGWLQWISKENRPNSCNC